MTDTDTKVTEDDETPLDYSPITLKLQSPIPAFDGFSGVSELTFQEAELGHIIDAESASTEMDKAARVLAYMADTDLAVIRKLKARDLNKILDKCDHLMGN